MGHAEPPSTFEFPFPAIPAAFVARPNRFVVHARLASGETVVAFMPNPGRLWELLYPGVPLYLAQIPPGKLPRKTEYTVMAVERDGAPIMLHTHYTNDVAEFLLRHHTIPGLRSAEIVQREVRVGRSRYDFLLRRRGKPFYLEVKSCTLYGNGVAMFPDAVTERGRRHLIELAELAKGGTATGVVFIVHTPRVDCFMPDYHTDLAFSQALMAVRRRVKIFPTAVAWSQALTLAHRPPGCRSPGAFSAVRFETAAT